MGTTRLQIGLSTGLACALGLSISSKPAKGGTVDNDPPATFTAPEDQDMVITDLLLSLGYNEQTWVALTRDDGTVLGSFYLHSYNSISHNVSHNFTSGIRIPRGESATLRSGGGTYVHYSVSGYYAQP
jgi:hypothetical protein